MGCDGVTRILTCANVVLWWWWWWWWSQTRLPNGCLNVAVFCLSLMGTNYLDFLREAHRTLAPRGLLRIAEVASRMADVPAFVVRASGSLPCTV